MWEAALSAVSLVLLSSVLMLVYMRVLLAPARLLEEKVRRISQGDLEGPVALPRQDDLAQLARAVNQMCEDLGAARDRARAEEAARMEALEQLRHADRLITVGHLASGVAHELGTPLHVIRAAPT